MSKYSSIALDAISRIRQGANPTDAWKSAAFDAFPLNPASREKNCPRCTFLGLIDQGLIRGIEPGSYTRSLDNKRYAVLAVELLRVDPKLADHPEELWEEVQSGTQKQHNSQMNVVAALWRHGDIEQ